MTKSKTKVPKIATSRQLIRQSLTEFRQNLWPYLKIVSIILVPTNLLLMFSFFASDQSAQDFTQIAAIVMNVALIWAIIQRHGAGQVPSLRDAYYRGTAALVRFVIVTFFLVVMIIPAAFGATLFQIAVTASNATNTDGFELWLIGLIALVLAAPSFYLIVRYGLVLVGVMQEDAPIPIEALRHTRRLTLGHFWPVAGRLILMGVFLGLLSIPTLLITWGISLLGFGNVAATFFAIAAPLLALPVGDIYMVNLYRALKKPAAAEATE